MVKVANRVDDIVETANYFYLFDIMLDDALDILTESMIKKYHELLESGTTDSREDWFNEIYAFVP